MQVNRTSQPRPQRIPEDVIKKLHPTRSQVAEFAHQTFRVQPETSHTIADTLVPSYWCNISAKLKVGDIITAHWEDNSNYAEYIVIGTDVKWTKVAMLRVVDLTSKIGSTQAIILDINPVAESAKYEIKFVNNYAKFCVFRLHDNEKVHGNCASVEAAQLWLNEYIKSLAK